MKRIVLASTSPRRRDLLQKLRIPFEVVPPRFDEEPTDLPPDAECLFFAEQKARSVSAQFPDRLVLGCDTMIACDGLKIGKPSDEKDAERILRYLSGKTHQVLSAVYLLEAATGVGVGHVETALVTFRELTPQMIRDYVATGEPMGKAGAYAVQGKARDLFIERVEGEEEAVMGLPLRILREWFHSSSAHRA